MGFFVLDLTSYCFNFDIKIIKIGYVHVLLVYINSKRRRSLQSLKESYWDIQIWWIIYDSMRQNSAILITCCEITINKIWAISWHYFVELKIIRRYDLNIYTINWPCSIYLEWYRTNCTCACCESTTWYHFYNYWIG